MQCAAVSNVREVINVALHAYCCPVLNRMRSMYVWAKATPASALPPRNAPWLTPIGSGSSGSMMKQPESITKAVTARI